jgi:hypothetical protein
VPFDGSETVPIGAGGSSTVGSDGSSIVGTVTGTTSGCGGSGAAGGTAGGAAGVLAPAAAVLAVAACVATLAAAVLGLVPRVGVCRGRRGRATTPGFRCDRGLVARDARSGRGAAARWSARAVVAGRRFVGAIGAAAAT